jgi:hypothetical protein
VKQIDRIKAMDIDELANWLHQKSDYCGSCPAFRSCNGEQLDCIKAIKQWLESESEVRE